MRKPLSTLLAATLVTAACQGPALDRPLAAPDLPRPVAVVPAVPAAPAAPEADILGGLVGESGGGVGYGAIGTGRYGTIGHGSGTGNGYGVGRGSGRGRGVVAEPQHRSDGYAHTDANGWTAARTDHLSTFAADVDTASYTLARRQLTEGHLPAADSVRVEEMVNYFTYTYPQPDPGRPFSITMDAAPSPLAPGHELLRIGASSKQLHPVVRKPAHLVFLVDVSGSMSGSDRLPLAQRALRILVDHLADGDTVALVTYAGSTRLVLKATGLDQKAKILNAIEELSAGGSTAMGDGLALAYAEAERGLAPDAISRVLVLSDGDANVGARSHEQILKAIASQVKRGITLSTVGFGTGNYQDELMEQLADRGNGNAFYIDGLSQAKRVFAAQLGSTLEVVAKDVKLQVDFDPEVVTRYRLVGYENRNLADADFRNDAVDAGEIGAGHQVTALYEVELAKGALPAAFATVRVRYKAPTGAVATEAAYPMAATAVASAFSLASPDFRFAVATAAFADVLRGSKYASGWDLKSIRALAADATLGSAERGELLQLVDAAIAIKAKTRS